VKFLDEVKGLLVTAFLASLAAVFFVGSTDAASLLSASPLPTPVPPISNPEALDLITDQEHNGIPDALEALLRNLEHLDTEVREHPTAENKARLNAALNTFEKNLPFSERTQALQRHVEQLRGQLTDDLPEESFVALLHELKSLEAEMYDDPGYVIIERVIQGSFDERLNSKAQTSFNDPRNTRHDEPHTYSGSEGEAFSASTTSTSALAHKVFIPFAALGSIFAPDPACQSVNTLPSGQADFGNLFKGDVMLYDGAGKLNNFVYGRKFNHMAIYNGLNNQNVEQIYESDRSYTGDQDGGPRLSPIDYFVQNEDVCVSLGHFDDDFVDDGTVRASLVTVQGIHGTNGEKPYPQLPPSDLNYWLDKSATDKIYCSQLIWQVFNQAGVNIDSNDIGYRTWFVYKWAFLSWVAAIGAWEVSDNLVAPDEIYLHPDLLIDSEGVNP
jgi:hypothetical protein